MKKQFGIVMVLFATVVLLAVIACGSNATAPVPTQPPPTEEPATPATIEVTASIEDAAVVAPEEFGGEYILKVTSGLPNGCAQFSRYTVERDGEKFLVEVTNLMPADPATACTEIYGLHEGEVALGSRLDAGETYTVAINDDFIVSFPALDPGGMAWVEIESPIDEIKVTEADGVYILTVISRLPKGSSCSKFNGYKINRRFAERMDVTVTHIEVTEDNVPCTADLPVVVTEIPFGADFVEGQTYTVSVNGTETTFPQDELASVEVPAPIEDVEVVFPEEVDGEYILKVTSGLPSGCAQFHGYEVERSGNHFTVDVTNQMPDPDEPIACTAIYGYHDEAIFLDGGLVPGEAYTVTINGELTDSFTVLDVEGLTMAEQESPIENIEITEADGWYLLTVVSRLPKGSSCSRFNGYQVDRRFAERIEVTFTHMEVAADDVPCTRDLPVVAMGSAQGAAATDQGSAQRAHPWDGLPL